MQSTSARNSANVAHVKGTMMTAKKPKGPEPSTIRTMNRVRMIGYNTIATASRNPRTCGLASDEGLLSVDFVGEDASWSDNSTGGCSGTEPEAGSSASPFFCRDGDKSTWIAISSPMVRRIVKIVHSMAVTVGSLL
jgi:hypothetical protein